MGTFTHFVESESWSVFIDDFAGRIEFLRQLSILKKHCNFTFFRASDHPCDAFKMKQLNDNTG